MKAYLSQTRGPVASCSRRTQGRIELLTLAAGIILACLTPKAMADKTKCACYGANYSGDPWNGRKVTVGCSVDCRVLNQPVCYDVTYSPPNPVPRFCQTLDTETGLFCHSLTNIITYSGQQGTPQCILNTGTNGQYTGQYIPNAAGTNICYIIGQCIDWHPVTVTNVELPAVHMDEYPDTNSVCRSPPPP